MQTILITGVTSGLGQASARLFIQHGWRVIGTGRRKERLDALAQELGSLFLGLCFDIQDKIQIEQNLSKIPNDFSQIDVLLNNAGLFLGNAPAQTSLLEDWETMIHTNILGLLYCTRYLLPGMLQRKKGHIINIGSIAGSRAFRTGNVYAASKAFVRHFSDNLRSDLLGTPLRVTCIDPGRTLTEFSLVHSKGQATEAEKDYEGKIPLKAEDIASAIFWAVSCPAHMNVSHMEIVPVCQADAGTTFSIIQH